MLPESEDYETIGGLVIVRLGYIPEAGASVEVDGALLSVLEAERTRVTRIRVERIALEEVEIKPIEVEKGAEAGASGRRGEVAPSTDTMPSTTE